MFHKPCQFDFAFAAFVAFADEKRKKPLASEEEEEPLEEREPLLALG